jgi:hypothetical protein
MGPYSHFIMATRVITLVRPQDESEFYWGSIVPDIRYLAGMRRAQTHIDRLRIQEFITRYPHLKSFLQGYRLHCLMDEINLQEEVGKVFPLNVINWLFNGKITQQQITMLVELYFTQTVKTNLSINGGQNEVLAELGIQSSQTDLFLSAMQAYIHSPCLDTSYSTFQRLGIVNNSSIDRYMGAARNIQKSTLLRSLLLLGVKNAKLPRHAVAQVVKESLFQS